MTDNHFMDFPAKMQDGRLFTDYKSSCIMNEKSLSMTSFEFRNFLTRNGDQILKNNTKIVNEIAGCGQCSDYSVVPPYAVLSCNQDRCIQNVKDRDGLGVEIEKQLSEDRQKKIENLKNAIKNNKREFTFGY